MSRVFKKSLTPLTKGGQINVHKGKGAVEQTLPSRGALNTLTAGDPAQRTMQNYSKATPMANPNLDSPDINDMSTPGSFGPPGG
jgi:hypothetical protein